MRSYFYQLTSSRRLFKRSSDWGVYLLSRVFRRLLPGRLPRWLRKRRFWVVGEPEPVVLRPHTQDFSGAREMFLHREYHDVTKWIDSDECDFVVDLGSNIGLSVRLWQRCFPTARIAALEPDAENCQICRENVELGPEPERVEVFPFAVAANTCSVFLQKSVSTLGHRTLSEPTNTTLEVQAVSVDDLLRRMKHTGPIHLLKCDIEGAEASLFSNCRSWIGRVRLLVVELHFDYSLDDLLDDIRGNGGNFEVAHIDDRHATMTIACLRARAWVSRASA